MKLPKSIDRIPYSELRGENRLALPETFVLLFFACAFVGWIYEVVYYYTLGWGFHNSGFFYGPFIPIYGMGAMLILLTTAKLRRHPALVFIVAAAVATVLEYIVGKLLLVIGDIRLWDYSEMKYNLEGIICLKCSLIFGVLAIVLTYLLLPLMFYISRKIGAIARHIISGLLLFAWLADAVFSLIFNFKSRM